MYNVVCVTVYTFRIFCLPENQICFHLLKLFGNSWLILYRNLWLKNVTLLERNFGKNLEMQCYLIAIKRIASYITALLIPLDFRVHSFISFTVFAYTATKKKGTHYVMCVRCALFHSSMRWTDSPGPQGDFCWTCQGFAHILPSAHLTSIGLIKQQLQANRKSSLR